MPPNASARKRLHGDRALLAPPAHAARRRPASAATRARAPKSRNVTSTPRLDELGFRPHLMARILPRVSSSFLRRWAPHRSGSESNRLDQLVDEALARDRDVADRRGRRRRSSATCARTRRARRRPARPRRLERRARKPRGREAAGTDDLDGVAEDGRSRSAPPPRRRPRPAIRNRSSAGGAEERPERPGAAPHRGEPARAAAAATTIQASSEARARPPAPDRDAGEAVASTRPRGTRALGAVEIAGVEEEIAFLPRARGAHSLDGLARLDLAQARERVARSGPRRRRSVASQ